MIRPRRFRTVWATALLLLICACTRAPAGTGHIGVWRRTFGNGRSEVTFWRGPDGAYRFRANRWDQDGKHALRCGSEGPCLEYDGAEPSFEYHYRVFERPGQDGLFVECDGRPHGQSTMTPLQQIEWFTLEPGGRSLEVRLVEQNHVPHDAATVRARFERVADVAPD